LRGADVDADTLRRLRDQGVRYHTMAEIRQRGFGKVLKRVLREVDRGPDAFFVSIDVSALKHADMIAAGRVESNGMDIEQVTRAVRHVCAAKDIVGFEITARAPMRGGDQYVQVKASEVLNIVDYGDIAIDNHSTERSMGHVREIVREIAEAGAIPVVIGGDHSLEYPNVAALADVYGKKKVSVIHFDSHYDAWWGGAHLISHGVPVYRLIIEGHVSAADYIQVGLRSSGPDKSGFEWMREQGMRYHTMAEVEKRGWDAVIDRVVAEASEAGRKIHISFDIDVLDPAFATATGTPVPGGINMREAITIVRRLCAESNVVGFDLVELHPALDPTYKTTLNSAHIVKACLTGLAMNKEGKTAEHYLSPLSSEHALDDHYGDRQQHLDETRDEEEEAERKKNREVEE
jgi:agmatinase